MAKKHKVHPDHPKGFTKKGDRIYTPEQVAQKWEDYLYECKNATIEHPTARGDIAIVNKPRVPTLGGFKVFLNFTDETWNQYCTAQGYEPHHEICRRISGLILSYKLDGLVNGDGNTNGIIFDLKVNHGLNERSIIDQNINGGISVEFSFE